MASNIIAAPQPLTSQNLSLAEDIWKMWQSAAPFNELVEKESNLKRSLPQAFPQMEPAVKRSVPAGGQFPPVSVAQMQSNLAQQQLLQQQAALQQALARGQIPPSFVMTPVTSALNGVPQQISIQNQLAQLEKLQKEQQQHMQQQQLQAQQQHMQQQQHQLQQQQHLQLQQMLQQRAAMQGGTLPTIPGIPAQMLQGQQVRAGMPQMIDPRQAEQYAALLKMNPQVLQAQQAQLMAQAQAQAQQQAQQVPVTAQQMIPQMSGRRQTIGPATITPQMVGAIPRMHPRPSPQLIPTSSPLTMIPSSSTTPAARSPFQIPAVCPPTAPTQVLKASPPQAMKGPEDPLFIKFLQQARGLEIQLHSVLGDGMVRLPTITAPTGTPNPIPTKD